MSDNQSSYLEVFVVDELIAEGRPEKRKAYTKVGIAIPRGGDEGFNVHITTGVSVSGALVILPPQAQPRESEDRAVSRKR
ncbi:MAG: hypothetical protein RJS97_23565 [Parvibaculaceae bacterium]